jgi:hypothetical protein
MYSKSNRINAQGGDIVAAKAFSRNQAVFNEKARQYASQGVITTPGFLRLESTAPNSGVSSINFNTLDTSGVKTSTERRLKLSDTFTITDFSFYIGSVPATAQVSGPDDYAKQTLHTFPNPVVFSTKSDELEVLYNSFLTLRIDTTTFLDSIPLRQFYRVGTAQQGTGGGGAGFVLTQASEWPLSMYGRTQLLPTIELNGQSNIEFSIQLPNATNLGGVSATVNNNLVIILQGFLNQGAATVQRRVQKQLR